MISGIEMARPMIRSERSPRCRGDRDDVVEAHHRVGDDDGADRAPEVAGALDAAAVLVLRHDQLDADPQQQQAADQLQVGEGHQLDDEDREDDPEDDRTGGSREDRLVAILLRQIARSQRDHDRIVAGEDDIDADDLAERGPED